MPRLIPRSIRGQLILGTALLQCLLVVAVFGYVYNQQRTTLRNRTSDRLAYQVRLLSSTAARQMKTQDITGLQSILEEMLDAPSIRAVRVTNLTGHTLAYSSRTGEQVPTALSPSERWQLTSLGVPRVFDDGTRGMVAVANINVEDTPVGLAWIYPDNSGDQVDLSSLLRSALIFAFLAIAANALFSLLLARSVTRPLGALLRATKLLVRDSTHRGVFPLKTRSVNAAGELTRSFNGMVAALNHQRAGLNDTLALLDSLLANAPIGFAFFDREMHYVRLNHFLAEMDNLSISEHMERTVQQTIAGPVGVEFAAAIERVFLTGKPVRDLELNSELAAIPHNPRTWLVSLYPVCTDPTTDAGTGAQPPLKNNTSPADNPIRWVGAVIVDVTDRKVSEERLRRTEKLAATGRLAASIAHEINNPLEAVTNLLYLLHQQPLDLEARQYAEMAQQELARVSQITQQTLRFYRQASKPVPVSPTELRDSVLALHQGRIYSARVEVERRYRSGADLLAFSGEMRQLFANLIGNALDAMPKGGRLILSVRPSCDWKQPEICGARIVVADTGSGMDEAVRRRIFEAFFTTKEATGTGLGLWISSEIIAKHQGTVRVRSRPFDTTAARQKSSPVSGTVFMLFFPFDGAASKAWAKEQNSDRGNQPLSADEIS